MIPLKCGFVEICNFFLEIMLKEDISKYFYLLKSPIF